MAYINPLHAPLSPSQYSSYSTLTGAVSGGGQATSQFTSPHRHWLPQLTYTPASKWKNDVGRVSKLRPPITFDCIGQSGQGVPMRELSARSVGALAAIVQGAGDQVFANTGVQRITFRILWPGYNHVEWARSIEVVPAQGPITRAQLGAAVASNFARFVEKARYENNTATAWSLSHGGIRFEHLVLVSLVNVIEDVWQANVAVDFK